MTDMMAEPTEVTGPDEIPTEEAISAQRDFFDPKYLPRERVTLSDGKTWVEVGELTEGQRGAFLNSQSTAMVVSKNGDQRMNTRFGDTRFHLLKTAISDWNVVKGGNPFDFSAKHVEEFIRVLPTSDSAKVENKIYELNPTLRDGVTVEDIDEQIEELQRQREDLLEREGKENT